MAKIGRKINDLTGRIFGRLTVLGVSHINNYVYYWTCRCECGNVISKNGVCLKVGNCKSCGCLQREKGKNKTHGMTKTKIYRTWQAMKKRCNDPEHHSYKDYGGRDIKVCERWEHSFENFHEDMGPRPLGMTLDRIDVNGNYEPSNCRWATNTQQMNNRRDNIFITHNGQTKPVAEWARELNIPKATIKSRLRYGHGSERALSTKRFKRGGEV